MVCRWSVVAKPFLNPACSLGCFAFKIFSILFWRTPVKNDYTVISIKFQLGLPILKPYLGFESEQKAPWTQGWRAEDSGMLGQSPKHIKRSFKSLKKGLNYSFHVFQLGVLT